MSDALETGFLLDRQWRWLRDEMDSSKKPALAALSRALESSGVPWALIGGLAVQVHAREPRTTLDIDVAVGGRELLPVSSLESAGFRRLGEHPHSENWAAEDGTPVQFTHDPQLREAIGRAVSVSVGEFVLRVIDRVDLLHQKLRAGSDPAGRRSKRLQDLADAQGLIEQDAALLDELSEGERRLLSSLPS